jgi:hypothetical protein
VVNQPPSRVSLPSRYEDLDQAFRGRLRPNPDLIAEVNRAFTSMQVSGGIRFLPVFGRSGSGKSSAALELSTHLPEADVRALPQAAIEDPAYLADFMSAVWEARDTPRLLIAVVDQYEEQVAQRTALPTQFVEQLSLLDRGEYRSKPTLFIWLTTSSSFQTELADATSRNRRILLRADFELTGPERELWPGIIEETFEFHNNERSLADFGVLIRDLESVADASETLGHAIEQLGERLARPEATLQDLSRYRVAMLWPVTDGTRIARVVSFTNPREGYRLNWTAFYRELNVDDQRQLPLQAYNRARLYFDVRLIPIAAADLMTLARDLDDQNEVLHRSYLGRFELSHFVSILRGTWNPEVYSPLRERPSQRADQARAWYETATTQPVLLGRRIARILTEIGLPATHEAPVRTPHGSVRADVLVKPAPQPPEWIIELKAFGPAATMPSAIREAIKTTLRRHAVFAGFLARQ